MYVRFRKVESLLTNVLKLLMNLDKTQRALLYLQSVSLYFRGSPPSADFKDTLKILLLYAHGHDVPPLR